MGLTHPDKEAAGQTARRLFVYNGGMIRPGRIRRILTLAGHDLRLGLPGPNDRVAVWGRSPIAVRGERVAQARHVPLLRVEDAFLRSVHPGRSGSPPLGLLIDPQGVHFDASSASALETLLAKAPLDDAALLTRARDGMARLAFHDLSKYNAHDPDAALPDPGYVLVVDQLRGDASVRYSGVPESTFREMLVFAQEEHPGARIVIKAHPETALGHRPGHYGPDDATGRINLLTAPVSPHRLLEGAVAVYTLSSQLGFEAILAGHRPRVFGQPFYAGWGLSADENPVPRRRRNLTRAQLFAAAMILYPTWYDPCRDRLCSFEAALDQLEAETHAFREDRRGHVAVGMRLWKRARLQAVFGRERKLRFTEDPARAQGLAQREDRDILVWATKDTPALAGPALVRRVEDGFVRSRGLGASLTPPLSLVTDDLGIYYDPNRESRLERLIAGPQPAGAALRAERLISGLIRAGLSKYNIGTNDLPPLPQGLRILVPGQVEDDASIRVGADAGSTNLGLLRRVRAENPAAVLIYKPHPDVEAGLRRGAVPAADLAGLADVVAVAADSAALIGAVDEVWTMTSLLGFEALLRGKAVTCFGAPFYAGWGLTRDLGATPARRQARPGLMALAHAALIAYPRYFDPLSGLPCPPEVVMERLAKGEIPPPGPLNRGLSKLQGAFASFAHLWR